MATLEYKERRKAKVKAWAKKWRATEAGKTHRREKRKLYNAKQPPEKARQRGMRFRRGLAEKLGGPRPEQCGVSSCTNTDVVFDHCHSTMKFRGWICNRCNRALGMALDSPVLLRELADYLEVDRSELSRIDQIPRTGCIVK